MTFLGIWATIFILATTGLNSITAVRPFWCKRTVKIHSSIPTPLSVPRSRVHSSTQHLCIYTEWLAS